MTECKHRWEQVWPGSYQCNKCDNYAHVEQPKLTMPNEYGYSVASIKPSYTLSFHDKDNKMVGTFDFNEGKMHFEGDVTESGKIFVDWVVESFKQRIKDAVDAEREACAKVADEWAHAYPHPSKVIGESIRARGKA